MEGYPHGDPLMAEHESGKHSVGNRDPRENPSVQLQLSYRGLLQQRHAHQYQYS